MSETGYNIVTDQRKEILKPMFNHIIAGESFYLVGGASMGKTRLLEFLMREDVQKHYLKDSPNDVWLVRVDMNRLGLKNEAWAFFELLLSSIVLEMSSHENMDELKKEFMKLNRQVIKKHDLLLALRHFELAANILCQGYKIKLVFLLDEFDKIYSSLSVDTFSQLRGVRDANKYFVLYGLLLRDLPERLRPSPDNEHFYELISRNMLVLGPYSREDTLQIMKKLEDRKNFPLKLDSDQRECIYEASGGQIGLLQALQSTLMEDLRAVHKLGASGWLDWFAQQPYCHEECRKVWEGLSPDERDGLSTLAWESYDQIPPITAKLLRAKGIIQFVENSPTFFSPLFERYVRSVR